jgi:hypothetical protein
MPTASGSTVWNEFAAVDSITPPSLEADDIETSHMTTPGQVKTFMAGWADPGEIEMTLAFEKAQAATLYSIFRKQLGYRVEFNDAPSPSGSKLFADGYIKSIGPEVDRENLTTVNVTIKASGSVLFVPSPAGA